MSYNPSNWYWTVAGSTSQVWSSARAIYVPVTDTAYAAWLAAGNLPSRILNEAELLEVIQQQAPGSYPQFPSGLVAYAAASWAKLLAAGRLFNVATSGASAVSVLCDGKNSTRADLALLTLFGQANPTGTKVWVDNGGVSTVLTGAQFVTLATLAGNWTSDTYPALQTLLGEINASPPTVTTTAQIDAYAWPAS